jgi:hypothetical protein
VKGTRRHDVARQTGAKHGFEWGGWGVPESEGWHFENRKVKPGVYGVVGKVASAVKRAVSPSAATMLKWRWTGFQRMLKSDYGYRGAIDNKPGAETKKAMRRFLTAKGYSKRANGWGLAIVATFNRNDVKAIQQWLNETGRKAGDVDGIPGRNTHAAWDIAEAANGRAYARVK